MVEVNDRVRFATTAGPRTGVVVGIQPPMVGYGDVDNYAVIRVDNGQKVPGKGRIIERPVTAIEVIEGE